MLKSHMIELLRKHFVRSKTLQGANGEIEALRALLRANSKSRAECFQDVWAATAIGQEGFFVEFGAADGKTISNTYLLETEFGWKGILAEPCRAFHDQLERNRKCQIDHRAVWTSTGEELSFSESTDAFLSGVASPFYLNAKIPVSDSYLVKTVTLTDLLSEYRAPEVIDFLSIDIEGGEKEILEKFINENRYLVRLVCIEHSWRKGDSQILNWMESKGFQRVYRNLPSRDYWFQNSKLVGKY
jgi:FkbM family methyltransferase